MSVLVALAQLAACLGLGALILAAAGLLKELRKDEAIGLAFTLGMGALGWLVQPLGLAGLLSPVPLALLLAACATGGLCALPLFRGLRPRRPDGWVEWLLTLLTLAVIGLALVQTLAPPTDSDTLAYHFALPRQFLAAGRIEFVPRAIDGAVPLLLQMTYVPVLGLGGERALTLWTMLSGLMGGLLVLAAARRHVGRTWAWGGALLYLTLPAAVYGWVSGQVELRLAMFTLAAAWACAEALARQDWRWAMLAGLGAGLFAASKYTGLFLGIACALPFLASPARIRLVAAYGAAALVAAMPWYAWNWWNSGDPVFPLLYGLLKAYYSPGLWSDIQDAAFRSGFYKAEQAVPQTLGWFLAYPFRATFDGFAVWESARTGLGVLPVLMLPFALAGAWARRGGPGARRLGVFALIALAFYVLWFFIGSSQRIRHLLPIVPLAGIALLAAAQRGTERHGRGALLAGLAAALMLQMGGLALYSLNAMRHVLSGESRQAYLERMVNGAHSAFELNKLLGPDDRVFLAVRQMAYLLTVPHLMGHTIDSAIIPITPQNLDPASYRAALERNRITHVFLMGPLEMPPGVGGINTLTGALVRAGCLSEIISFEEISLGSRTLGLDAARTEARLLRADWAACPISTDQSLTPRRIKISVPNGS
ncbi:hypothetical protein WV31_13210 [Magnetospirillum sp. ME-1]|uniref:ArnT family glycosyltransferase n=1 Tax=Magnetospirillum sp. ME-1 TaxID=1639348 RepID=UPI000A17D7F8|nr:glycosyltransferase family 39 protein [Magnetospirillum sp. ME-1]ARJ66558.1 hypothetical protein WV31_13210 [Magnetospirillum sp. ME-1]